MPTHLSFSVESKVDASSDAVWEVLGDFGTEHRWTKSLEHCERDTHTVKVGTIRTCKLPKPLMGRTSAREQLTEYEPGRTLAYILEGSAGPFASASSRWSTTARANGGTVVTVEGFFTTRSRAVLILVWPLAKPMLRRLTRRVIGELEAFVVRQAETAQPEAN